MNDFAKDAEDKPVEGRPRPGPGNQDTASAESVAGPQAVPGTPVTGESAVDDALARLAQIGEAPTAEHVEIYDDVHDRLTDTLADVDED